MATCASPGRAMGGGAAARISGRAEVDRLATATASRLDGVRSRCRGSQDDAGKAFVDPDSPNTRDVLRELGLQAGGAGEGEGGAHGRPEESRQHRADRDVALT